MLLIVAAGLADRFAIAQTPSEVVETSKHVQLPVNVTSELEKLQDFSFSYAQPGFYALLQHIKQTGIPSEGEASISIARWTDLLERSADYRGRLITIGGVIGRNSPWQLLDEQHRDIGSVWELQLRTPDQPILCKCILLGDASDLPLGATVNVTGRFVMIQQYYGDSKRLSQAALMIGVGPSVVIQNAPPKTVANSGTPSPILIVTIAAGLLAAFVIVRKSARSRAMPLESRQAAHPAPFSLADDLARWAASADDIPRDDRNAERK